MTCIRCHFSRRCNAALCIWLNDGAWWLARCRARDVRPVAGTASEAEVVVLLAARARSLAQGGRSPEDQGRLVVYTSDQARSPCLGCVLHLFQGGLRRLPYVHL